MRSQSPWPTRLLDYILPADLRHLTGDLEEEYNRNRERMGNRRALIRLCLQILRSLPFFMGQALKWNFVMIAHYLKTALRLTKKHFGFSLINILGLAASMAVCLLILLFIVDQKSYDRFHEDYDRIYRVISDFNSPSLNAAERYATTPAELANVLETNYPGVREAVHVRNDFQGEFRHGNQDLSLSGLYASPDFFRLFGFELLAGNPKTALREPGSIILTAESARRLFGEETDPLGKSIEAMGDRTYTVTGIVDSGVKSHIDFQSLVSYSTVTATPEGRERMDNWTRSIYNSYTYLRLEEGAEERLSERFPELISDNFTTSGDDVALEGLHLQSVTSINLGPALWNEIGMIMPNFILWFLIGFGVVVILVACFNYVSLTVARGLNRSREVGVRKVLGAARSNILKQFLTESVLIALLALLFALLILNWLLPQFNSLYLINFTENQIALNLFGEYWIYILFFLFSVLIGVLAGFYPALRFTSFQPAGVLQGARTAGRGSQKTLKKGIAICQFTISIVFIITTLVLLQQFRYMSDIDYGFEYGPLVNVQLQDIPFERFEQNLSGHPGVASISASNVVPALGSWHGVWVKSDSVSDQIRGAHFTVAPDYLNTMGLNLVSGRNFNPERGADSVKTALLSRSAVNALGLGNPKAAVGATITVNETNVEVIGVTENFVTVDPLEGFEPAILRYNPDRFQYAVVRVHPGSKEAFTSDLEQQWAELGSVHTPKYQLFSDQINNNPTITIFRDFIKVFSLIAFFTIMISCLGLLGMAMFSAENRVREIGVRKVFGATRRQIVYLLSKEYLAMIAIAILVATPLAWMLNHFWLSFMSNSVTLGPAIFLIGIIGCSGLALLTVASQALRAARVKVVDNLRSE